jgi:TRAP-type uncharacterized transport system substrate-binding protein
MNQSGQYFHDQPANRMGVGISGVVLVIFALVVGVAWWFMPPPLPDTVRLGTGPVGSHYANFGEQLKGEVEEHGVELDLVGTAGSMENIRLLLDGEIDVALVQSGNLSDAETQQLVSIATVFYEPVLVAYRADWESDHIEGGRIAIGAPGSGANALTRELLDDQGVREGEPAGTEFVEIGEELAVRALESGEVDSAVFVTSVALPWVHSLFADPTLEVTHFDMAEAFTRHYRYLRRLVIPAGLIDLKSEIPARDVQVIATTASLVIRPEFNGAIIPLLIESAREELYQGGLLAGPEEFPSAYGVEAPLADEALRYFEQGPSFLYRWLPFRYAHAATRLAVVLVPLLTLLYPLLRSAEPTYRWFNQRRIYRWYHVLQGVEAEMDATGDTANLERIGKELDRVDEEIRQTRVPARFGANLYALRAHQRLLVERVEALKKGGPD